MNDLERFKRMCGCIIANRMIDDLDDVADRVYTRDLPCAVIRRSAADLRPLARNRPHCGGSERRQEPRAKQSAALRAFCSHLRQIRRTAVNLDEQAGAGSKQSAGNAVRRLVDAKAAVQTNRGKRERAFEALEMFGQFNIAG